MTTTTPPTQPQPALPPASPFIAVALALAVAGFHFACGLPLARTVLMQAFNWVFDFDSSRYVAGWCEPGAQVANHLELSFTARHPLSLAARPLCLALRPLFDTPEAALVAFTALCAGGCVSVAYWLAARYCRAEFDRVLLALSFALSAQPLLLGVIPETYGFAMAGIGLTLVMLSSVPAASDTLLSGHRALLSLVLNLGITVTNAALNLIAAAVLGWQRVTLRRWVGQTLRVWLASGLAVLLTLGVSTAVFAPELLAGADAAPKRLWWAININRAEPATLPTVVATFLVYNVVAPVTEMVNLPPPDGHPMADFRAFRFSSVGAVATALWCAALVYAVWAAWRQAAWRRLLVVAGLWLALNVVLHWYWQYRGSVFIYGAHSSFALYLVAVMGYAQALRQFRVAGVRAAAVAFTALLALNNLASYAGLIDFLLRSTPPP